MCEVGKTDGDGDDALTDINGSWRRVGGVLRRAGRRAGGPDATSQRPAWSHARHDSDWERPGAQCVGRIAACMLTVWAEPRWRRPRGAKRHREELMNASWLQKSDVFFLVLLLQAFFFFCLCFGSLRWRDLLLTAMRLFAGCARRMLVKLVKRDEDGEVNGGCNGACIVTLRTRRKRTWNSCIGVNYHQLGCLVYSVFRVTYDSCEFMTALHLCRVISRRPYNLGNGSAFYFLFFPSSTLSSLALPASTSKVGRILYSFSWPSARAKPFMVESLNEERRWLCATMHALWRRFDLIFDGCNFVEGPTPFVQALCYGYLEKYIHDGLWIIFNMMLLAPIVTVPNAGKRVRVFGKVAWWFTGALLNPFLS